jgi:hypothetical protein
MMAGNIRLVLLLTDFHVTPLDCCFEDEVDIDPTNGWLLFDNCLSTAEAAGLDGR